MGLVLLFLVPSMNDCFALFTGMACGKHKLSPQISPKKTIEGSVGGLVAAVVFAVLLPMIIGPQIGSAVIKGGDSTYVELGVTKTVPTPGIFLAAAGVLLLTLIPVFILRRREKHADN